MRFMKSMKKLSALCLAVAMVVTGAGSALITGSVADAASKKATVKLSQTKISVVAGKKVTLKVTKKNVKKVKSATWTSKDKKIATVTKKGVVTGIKAGKSTTISCKIKYLPKGGKKYKTKTLKCKVTVKAGSTSTTDNQTPNPAREPLSDPKAANVVTDGKLDDTNITSEHTSRYGLTTKDNGIMRTNLSAQDITKVMGLGWNIGNSLEQTGAGNVENKTEAEKAKLTDADWVKGYETNAGNPVSSQKMITGLKRYGINTIRIPIAWSNMMTVIKQKDGSNYYQISDAYFDRVEEVINYCLNEEMYVVINIHWDGQWWGMFGDKDISVRKEAWKKYEDMWTQIANRYVDYSDRLIFEGANEELGVRLNDNWKGDGGSKGVLTAEETYALTNEINQKFVDIVRGLGINKDGAKNNNYYRMLLIPGYDTNLHQTCGDQYSDKAKEKNDKLSYTMPTDVEENGIKKLFVSIHYYDPLGWGIAKTSATYDTPKGPSHYMDTWGTEEDYAAMLEDFVAVKEAYLDKGYGVIFGEFGCVSVNKDGIPDYFKEFFSKCKEYGAVPIMWDEGSHVNRKGTGNGGYAYFVYEDIGQVFCEITGSTVTLKESAKKVLTMTGKPKVLVADNQDPLVVATWEGDFVRNSNGTGSINYDVFRQVFGESATMVMQGNTTAACFNTKSKVVNPNYPGLEMYATSDQYHWHSHFTVNDWSKIKEPGIRITMHNDLISQSAQLQLAYTNGLWEDGDDYDWKYEATYEQVESVAGDTYTDEQIKALPSTVKYISDDGERFADALPKLDENNQPVLADTAWIGKALRLNVKYLENEPVVLITTNTYLGVDFQKVEIVDLAYKADGSEFIK